MRIFTFAGLFIAGVDGAGILIITTFGSASAYATGTIISGRAKIAVIAIPDDIGGNAACPRLADKFGAGIVIIILRALCKSIALANAVNAPFIFGAGIAVVAKLTILWKGVKFAIPIDA